MTIAKRDRREVPEVAREFVRLGFRLLATEGTRAFLADHGISADLVAKLNEGRPNILDAITNREISLIVNTPIGKQSQYDDSYIRKAAIKHKITYITTLAAAKAAVKGIAAIQAGRGSVKPLQEYLQR
jgi:carbamoyl-phosphate synthase large subunit